MAAVPRALPKTRAELAALGLATLFDRYPELGYYFFRSYAKREPGLFPGYTYFGVIGEDGMPKIVNRKPVAWKGVKFGHVEEWPSTPELARRTGAPAGVIEGLRKAIEISRRAGAEYRRGGHAPVWAKKYGKGVIILPTKVVLQGTMGERAPSEWSAAMAEGAEYASTGEALMKTIGKVRLIRPKTALKIPRRR